MMRFVIRSSRCLAIFFVRRECICFVRDPLIDLRPYIYFSVPDLNIDVPSSMKFITHHHSIIGVL